MPKFLTSWIALSAILAAQATFPAAAAPQKQGRGEVFVGTFAPGETYAKDVYIIPATIYDRGDTRRFVTHEVYRQDQNIFYRYRQEVNHSLANCKDGTTTVLKGEDFNDREEKMGEQTMDAKFKVPDPGSVNEKILDFVCNYKH